VKEAVYIESGEFSMRDSLRGCRRASNMIPLHIQSSNILEAINESDLEVRSE